MSMRGARGFGTSIWIVNMYTIADETLKVLLLLTSLRNDLLTTSLPSFFFVSREPGVAASSHIRLLKVGEEHSFVLAGGPVFWIAGPLLNLIMPV